MAAPDDKEPRFLRTILAFVAIGLVILLLAIVLTTGWQKHRAPESLISRQKASSGAPVTRTITARGNLAENERTTIELFEHCSPSVVFITTLVVQRDVFSLDVMQLPRGTGSGFVWDQRGHIVTNMHVLQDANAARVTLEDGSTYRARLVGQAPDKDLAVLQIQAPVERLHPIALGKSTDLKVGQSVFAIGNPFGLDQTLSVGVISGLGRQVGGFAGGMINGAIQTDAAINPGNSGGPLLDSAGRLIGVNTAIISPTGVYAGIGFAIPADTVNSVVPQLISHGRIVRPRLGIHIAEDALVRRLRLTGVMVLGVESGSPAEQAGLRGIHHAPDGQIIPGDLIVGMDGHPIAHSAGLFELLEKHQAGETVVLQIQREGSRLGLKVVLAAGS
jgi:S1-C subfamily serine protease